MPVEIGPEWDPAAHDYGDGNFFPSTEPGRDMAAMMGLVTLGAISAGVGLAGFIAYEAAGALAGACIPDIAIGAVEGSGAAEEIIATSILRSGATTSAEQASLEANEFLVQMAYRRNIQALMTEEAALTAAQDEAAQIMVAAALSLATIGIALDLAISKVNEQESLNMFFTSGLGHF
jgi:hypothetical protein